MAFIFNWPRFSDQFHASARSMLESALNKGSKPPIIADKIEVVELEMGTQPPELEVRDIGELTMDQFRGIFRLSYSGDAYIVLRTKVQANPLIHKNRQPHLLDGGRGMVAAQAPLVVPMNLRLSNFKLNSYVVLVVSKQKGITLVFKTDPLQNVDVNSTFDRIGVLQKYIQKEIETQLREMFREDLPGIIHKLSQQWLSKDLSKVARVEVPYARKFAHPPREDVEEAEEVGESASQQGEGDDALPRRRASVPPSAYGPMRPTIAPYPQGTSTTSRAYSYASSSLSHSPSLQSPSYVHTPRSTVSAPTTPAASSLSMSSSSSTFPDIENYDPTYGLRPEELPAKGEYAGFAKLWGQTGGLAELAEEVEGLEVAPPEVEDSPSQAGRGAEVEEEEEDALEEWESSVAGPSGWHESLPPGSEYWDEESQDPALFLPATQGSVVDYETVYAVGGGTVTRPRVLHSQSLIGTPSDTATVRSSAQGTVRASPSLGHSISRTGSFAGSQAPAPGLSNYRASSLPLGLRIQTPSSAASTPVAMALGTGTRPSPLSFGSGYFQGWEAEQQLGSRPPLQTSRPQSARTYSIAGAESAYLVQQRSYTPSLLGGAAQPMGRTRSMPASRRVSPPGTGFLPASQSSSHARPVSAVISRPAMAPHAPPAAQAPVRPSRSSSGLTYSGSTPPSSEVPPTEEDEPASPSSSKSFTRGPRRGSISQRLGSHSHLSPFDTLYVGSPPRSEYGSDRGTHAGGIILKPAINARVSQLAMLSNSHQTLSPYTRSMQHYAVRSAVPKPAAPGAGGGQAERAPVRARRKRTYHIGKATPATPPEKTPSSPRPASDYSEYFHVSPQMEETPILVGEEGLRQRAPFVAA